MLKRALKNPRSYSERGFVFVAYLLLLQTTPAPQWFNNHDDREENVE
jgi:hypothetical protein